MKTPTMVMWARCPLHPSMMKGWGSIMLPLYTGAQSFTDLMRTSGNDSFCESSMSFVNIVAELEKITARKLWSGEACRFPHGLEDVYLKYRAPVTEDYHGHPLSHRQ